MPEEDDVPYQSKKLLKLKFKTKKLTSITNNNAS